MGIADIVVKYEQDNMNSHKHVVDGHTIFVGTPPELDIALYTVCVYARPNANCHVTPDGENIAFHIHTVVKESRRPGKHQTPIIINATPKLL